MNFIQNIDESILNFIQTSIRNPIMDSLITLITSLGNGGFIWIAIAITFMFTEKYRKYGYIILISLIVSAVIGDIILKNIVGRLRPFHINESIKLLIASPTSFSFPSGHSMSSFTAAIIIFMAEKKFGIIAFALAGLIAFSRIYLYVHYPSDVLTGAILGMVCGFFTYKILINNKILKH